MTNTNCNCNCNSFDEYRNWVLSRAHSKNVSVIESVLPVCQEIYNSGLITQLQFSDLICIFTAELRKAMKKMNPTNSLVIITKNI